MSTPKKHHYVPICYLKEFCDYKYEFWKKRLDFNKITISNPSKECYEIDGNKIVDEVILKLTGFDDEYYIEKEAFKIQELKFEKHIKNISKNSQTPFTMKGEDYHLFIETIVTIKRRNPKTRDLIINTYKEAYKNETNIIGLVKTLMKEYDIKEMSQSQFERIKSSIQDYVNDERKLRSMFLSAFINKEDFKVIENITKTLFILKAYVLHSSSNKEFITSDNPGFTINNKKVSSKGEYGTDFELYFPLCPKTCLYIDSKQKDVVLNTQKTIIPLPAEAEIVNQINKWTMESSNKLIFSNSKRHLESTHNLSI